MLAPGSAATRPLRVGLNLLHLVKQSGGAGTYARELVPELLKAEPGIHITAFASRELDSADRDAAWSAEVEWVRLPLTVTHGPPWNALSALRAQWLALPRIAARRDLDVVHGLANVTPLVAPKVATVVTLLDLIWLHRPDVMTLRETLGMRLWGVTSTRMADRVIAISEAARSDMVETLGLDPERVDVTPLGVRVPDRDPAPEAELRAEFELGDRTVVLCVSQKRAHKNLAALLRAVVGLDVMLLLPGAPGPYEQELRRLAGELGIADRVRFPGWLAEDRLEGLYALAACFALPSLEEGFGLPVLEAMARGVPVCCANASSLPEVVGDAGLLFDPHCVEDIRRAISRLLADPGDLGERGRERSRKFTWRKTAEATLAAYRRAIATRRLLSLDTGWRR
jgi:glycosyltransferase involved in cell wall biosynthesis